MKASNSVFKKPEIGNQERFVFALVQVIFLDYFFLFVLLSIHSSLVIQWGALGRGARKTQNGKGLLQGRRCWVSPLPSRRGLSIALPDGLAGSMRGERRGTDLHLANLGMPSL